MIRDLLDSLPVLHGAYVVGGTVRDLLLNRRPADCDIVVLGNPEDAASRIAGGCNGRLVKLGKPGETLFRIVSGDRTIDISALHGNSIEEDLEQRDFTVNAMACEISTGRIIDCMGGRQDIESGTIRMVSEAAFRKDPIRLLRAYRLAGILKFDIDPLTEHTIRRDTHRIRQSAGERIREELFRLLQAPDVYRFLVNMAENRLLFGIFPELEALCGCRQNKHHDYDVLDHTLYALLHLESLVDHPERFPDDLGELMRETAEREKAGLLKCAILLHDMGKPAAKFRDPLGDVHFHRHEKIGAEMVKAVSERLKFSNRQMEFICFVVKNHLRPLFLFKIHQTGHQTPRAVTRFFIRCGENTPALLLHAVADQKGKKAGSADASPDAFTTDAFTTFSEGMIRRFFSDYRPRYRMPRLLTGSDLIEEFGLTPSPLFGEILSMVEEARLSNTIHLRTEAIDIVRHFLESRRKRKPT